MIELGRHIDAETPPSLLLRLRDPRDESAWQAFADVYSPLVYNFCRLRGLQPSDAADVTQEVLLRISRAIPRFDYDRKQGLFRDWVARIVSNEVHRHFASRKELAPLCENWDSKAGNELWNEHFHQHILSTAIERCRPKFSSDMWELFSRSWLDKVPAEDVAQQFNVDITKVYKARSKVLKRLRQEVSVLADDLY